MEHISTHDNSAQATELCALIGKNNHQEVETMVKQLPKLVHTFGRHPIFSCDVLPLHIAATYGHAKCMRILLAHGANPNGAVKLGYTPLHWALTKKVAELLLDAGAEIDHTADCGRTPLWAAFFSGSVDRVDKIKESKEIASLLLAKGADINATSRGDTLLHAAVVQSSTASLRFFLERNAKINQRDENGLTPLDLAIRRYSSNPCEIHKRALDVFEEYGILFFPKLNQAELFKFPSGEDVFEKGAVYRTFLHKWARLFAGAQRSERNENEYVKFSIQIVSNEFGCTVSAMSEQDLYHACPQADLIKKVLKAKCEKAKILVHLGDDRALKKYIKKYPWVISYDAKTASSLLVEAMEKAERINCLRVLLKNKIDIEEIHRRYGWSTTVLHLAIENKNSSALSLLVEHGVDCLTRDEFGRTPMARAVKSQRAFPLCYDDCIKVLNQEICQRCIKEVVGNNYKKAKQLLAEIVDGNIKLNGLSFLRHLVQSSLSNIKAIKMIPLAVAKGVDINQCSDIGSTILHELVYYGNSELFLLALKPLLDAGAQINKGRISPLTCAVREKRFSFAESFLEHGAIVEKELVDDKYGMLSQCLKPLFQQKYDEQQNCAELECCVCFEVHRGSSKIPCGNKHSELICEDCYKAIPHKSCPICRGVLGEFVT
jgi:ankyrin repeat protein